MKLSGGNLARIDKDNKCIKREVEDEKGVTLHPPCKVNRTRESE